MNAGSLEGDRQYVLVRGQRERRHRHDHAYGFEQGEHACLTARWANVCSDKPCPPVADVSVACCPPVPNSAASLTGVALQNGRVSCIHRGASQVRVRLSSGQLILESVAISAGHGDDDTNRPQLESRHSYPKLHERVVRRAMSGKAA